MPFIDFKKELNPDQYAAVCAPEDVPALVLAGAGSGKTRTLTYRVAHFLTERGIYPQELLLLTFTNKAANQMLERVGALTGIETWKFWGGTFHSVANKFLRREGGAIGLDADFTIADAEDSEKMLKQCVNEAFPKFFAKKENPRAGLLKEIISYSRNTCNSVEDSMRRRFDWLETPPDEIEKIAKVYESARRASSILDFDDLLELWLRLLAEAPEVCERYASRFKNVLVDEYQDTNTLQCRILDALCKSGRISAVGDDAQCIYSWRGANIENILRFKKRYPNGAIYKIGLNYRSTPQILNFANGILDGFEAGEDFKKSLTPSRGGFKKPVVIRAMDSQSQARIVADYIEELTHGSGAPYKLSDIAVLYRAHFQA
ncbi:MAG: ATP-dependent helicase, partial [Opitutales bacterium]|nr:ATP-dependent helicase [Opitutales bacterium]